MFRFKFSGVMKRFPVVFLITFSTFLHAQVKQGWYIGVSAGMSTTDNTFSSSGADRFRPGYSADIMTGYDFGSVLSLELGVGLGRSFASEQDCCLQRMYIYGDDGRRHLSLPDGMAGWKYSDMYSSISFQNYRLNLNFNILGFFPSLKTSSWALTLSPSVSAVRTSADLLLKETKVAVRNDISSWHLGYGGKVETSYTFARRYDLGLFCDARQLTGSPSDGLEKLHSSNLLSGVGVSFRFRFGLNGKKQKRPSVAVAQPDVDAKTALLPDGVEIVHVTEEAIEVSETENIAMVVDVAQTAQVADEAEPEGDRFVEDTRFPRVHFSFNSVWVEWDEREVVRKIASILRENPSLHVKLMGWGDKVGGDEVNLRVSKQRSDAIKVALVKQQIAADRIETAGGGIKYDAPCDAEARCVQVLVEL